MLHIYINQYQLNNVNFYLNHHKNLLNHKFFHLIIIFFILYELMLINHIFIY